MKYEKVVAAKFISRPTVLLHRQNWTEKRFLFM